MENSTLELYQLRYYEAELLSFKEAKNFLAASCDYHAMIVATYQFNCSAADVYEPFEHMRFKPDFHISLRDDVVAGANYAFVRQDDGELVWGCGLRPNYASSFRLMQVA